MSIEAGIYKTTQYLPGNEGEIGPDQLILVRTDGEFAPASALKPIRNVHNQWRFAMPGVKIPVTAVEWGKTLKRLKPEGFYRLTKEFTFGEGGKWVEGAIVQLGYTDQGDAILFIAQRRSPLTDNELWFSDRGIKVEDDMVESLVALAWYQEPERKP